MTDYVVGVLEDAIHLLQLLNDNPDGLKLAQITKLTGLVKNKVFRILFTLEKHQMVEQDERGYYHLGVGLLHFGQQVENQTLLTDASRAVMDRLVVETGESIFLGVIHGRDALCVAARESPQSIRLFAQVGRRAPLHSGGVPKVLLAFLPRSERHALIDQILKDESPNVAPPDRDALEKQLEKILHDGYAVVVDGLDKGAHSVAAPIRNCSGRVIAAISIAGPSIRFTEVNVNRYIELIRGASEHISHEMGYNRQEAAPRKMTLSGIS